MNINIRPQDLLNKISIKDLSIKKEQVIKPEDNEEIIEKIKEKVSLLLSVKKETLDTKAPFSDYGLDSLSSVELSNFLKSININVRSNDLLNGLNIDNLLNQKEKPESRPVEETFSDEDIDSDEDIILEDDISMKNINIATKIPQSNKKRFNLRSKKEVKLGIVMGSMYLGYSLRKHLKLSK